MSYEKKSDNDVSFIRQKQLLKMVPFSAPTLWRKVKAGEFPQPVKLSHRITAWPTEAVHEWIQSRTSKPQ